MQTQSFSRPRDPWFYQHVEEKVDQMLAAKRNTTAAAAAAAAAASASVVETVAIDEYLFRYDRGGFWVGTSAFKYTKFPNTRLTRWFLDDFLHTRMLYRALHASGQARQYMVQDLALPDDTVEEFVDFAAERYGIWPLWLCPLQPSPTPTLHPHDCRLGRAEAGAGNGNGAEAEAGAGQDGATPLPPPMLNVGLWGEPRGGPGALEFEAYIAGERALERKLIELGGMKWGYGQHYYPEEEFWSMFDKPWYDALREKYHAQHLPTMFDKVTVDVEQERRENATSWWRWWLSIWPLGGVWALRKAIQSKDYLLHRGGLRQGGGGGGGGGGS
jgi:delta24-sterol reductase